MNIMTYKTNKYIIYYAIFLAMSFAMLKPMEVQSQTKIYKEYEHRTDLTAMCILNFTIADTMNIDITMLVPSNTDVAYELMNDFGFGNAKTKEELGEAMRTEEEGLVMGIVNIDNPKKSFGPITSSDDYKKISVIVYNTATGAILVFHNVNTFDRLKQIVSTLSKSLTDKKVLPDSNCK